jgi:hypothetical protein
MTVAAGSLFLVGIPMAALVRPPDQKEDNTLLHAPFLGLCTIILVLQNAIYCNIPLRTSVPVFWLAVFFLWVVAWRLGRLGSISIPRYLLVPIFCAYLAQNIGLLLVGSKAYAGRAWYDQLCYISISEFLIRQPIFAAPETLANKLYLVLGYLFREDRIGQSVFHGFVSASTLFDSKSTFEPTILITPLLIGFAIALYARRLELPPGLGVVGTLFGALLPGATLCYMESFLSQAFVTPLLLSLPLFVFDFLERPSWRTWLGCSLLFAACTSIYTELLPLFLFVLVLNGLAHAMLHRRSIGILAVGLTIPLSGVLFNPFYGKSVLGILRRIDSGVGLEQLYPWAYSPQGLLHLWFGEFGESLSPPLQTTLRILAVLSTLAGILGWWRLWRRKRNVAALSPLFFLAFLLLVRAVDDKHPYQYFKVLISISPLLAFGFVGALWPRLSPVSGASDPRVPDSPDKLVLRVAGGGMILGVGGGIALGLAHMMATTCDPRCPVAHYYNLAQQRSRAAFFLDPATRALERQLNAVKHHNVLIVTSSNEDYGGFGKGFFSAWLTYFARHNNVWVTNPYYLTHELGQHPVCAPSTDLHHLPPDLYVLTRGDAMPPAGFQRKLRLLWEQGPYRLWNARPAESAR